MIDRRSEILKLASSHAFRPALASVGTAPCTIDVGERHPPPKSEKRLYALPQLGGAADTVRSVGDVNVQDVGDRDLIGITSPLPRRSILLGEVVRELPFSLRALMRAAASADPFVSVADEPN